MTNGAAVRPAGRPAALLGRSHFLGELSDAQQQPHLFLSAFFLPFVSLFLDLFSSFSVNFAVDRKSMFSSSVLLFCFGCVAPIYCSYTTRKPPDGSGCVHESLCSRVKLACSSVATIHSFFSYNPDSRTQTGSDEVKTKSVVLFWPQLFWCEF